MLVTLPVTTATAERSFSTLKRLKTYLRSSMRDERLTSLAPIYVHAQTTPVEPVEVFDKFALTGPHKLNFLRYVCPVFVVLYMSLYWSFRLLWVVNLLFSIMSVASGGFALRPPPGLSPWTALGTAVPQTPCSASPFWNSCIRHCEQAHK